jgi:release factor glutamine methyltransferase
MIKAQSAKRELYSFKTGVSGLRTLGEALVWAEETFKTEGLPDPGHEALFIVAGLMGLRPTEVYLNRGSVIDVDRVQILRAWVTRRLGREPSQYITGSTEFRGLDLKVTPDVLIPRPETEILVSEAIAAIYSVTPLILDIGTGSGCIAVSMAKEVPGARVFATELSRAALKVADENAAIHKVAERIEFLEGDLFGPLEGLGLEASFDLVISNPPYVSRDEIQRLQPEVRLFEPEMALYGGYDGMEFMRRIVDRAPSYLKPGGALMLEIGYGQSEEVKKILKGSGRLTAPEIVKDYSGIKRIIKARKLDLG